MKKSIIYGMLTVVGASLTGCNDFLDDNRWPLDTIIDDSNAWNQEVVVQSEINALYNNFYGYGNGTGRNGTFYFESLNDDQVGSWGSSVQFNTWKHLQTPGTSTVWNSTYEVIRKCNNIITNLEKSTLHYTVVESFTGEAKLNRAWQYYDLVRHFGDVPLILTVLSPNDEAELYGARTDRDKVMDQALEDINYAIEHITRKSGKTEFSRDLAYAVKAEICLFEAAYAKYHKNDVARANKFYGEVVSACESLMGGTYELCDDYASLYNSVYTAVPGIGSLLSNKEVIFMKPYQQGVKSHSLVKYTNTGEILGMSKDAFENYLFIDGKPMSQQTDKQDKGAVTITKYTDKDGKEQTKIDIDITACLAVRDKRLAATIDDHVFYRKATWARPNGTQMASMSGYGVKKFWNQYLTLYYATTDNQSYTNAPLYWLAEIYLAYAEAKAELGTLTNDDLNKSINKLYKRAGLPEQTVAGLEAIADPANNMGISSLLWEIRRCRRCELMFDKGQRYWDLVRWHQLEILDNTKYPNISLGAYAGEALDEVFINNVNGYIDTFQGSERKFTAREYLFPLGIDQLNLNKNLVQNPGWESPSK